jgi:polar amino acid transport system permease protein
MEPPGFFDYTVPLLLGAATTLKITVIAELIALAIGVVVGSALLAPMRIVRWTCRAYVELFRGTSALIQLFFLFFVLPQFGIVLEPFLVAVLGLGLNSGAYCAEFIRGAVLSVPQAQKEAAIALGLSRFQAFRLVVFPQALPRALPPLANMSIDLLKLSSIVSLIAISDLTFVAYQINQTTLDTVSLFSVVLIFYFCVAQLISLTFRRAERRFTPLMLFAGVRRNAS